jgi:MFS family permease
LSTFAVPMLVASLIEAPIALASDRYSRTLVLSGALLVLALSLAGCALAQTPWWLALGLSVAGAASGVACGAAQAELVTIYPGCPHQAMSRWVAFAAVGDALTPPLIAAALWLGSYRAALWVLAVALGTQAIVSGWTAARAARRDAAAATCGEAGPAGDPDDAPALPLRAALATIRQKPELWWWSFAAASCALLDEVVVALAALRLDLDRGWGTGLVAVAMTGFSSGAVLGALVTEQLLKRMAPARLLIACTCGSLTMLALFIVAPWPGLALPALFALGCFAACHYPLVKGTAYALAPGQPGLVNAIAQLYVAVEVLLPLAAGAIAERFGLAIGLASLAFEPVVVLAVTLATCRKAARSVTTSD